MQYRADQVGSLLRPPELIEARTAFMDGRLALESLRAAEDRAILDALEMQRQTGIDVFTDGEFRRYNFYADMIDAVNGFVFTDEVPLLWRGEAARSQGNRAPGRIVGARLQQKRRLTEHEIPFLEAHAPGPIRNCLRKPSSLLALCSEHGTKGILDGLVGC